MLSMSKVKDITGLPIMKANCKACPFKPDEKGRWQNVPTANKVIERCLPSMNEQICHGTEGENRKPNNLCKGYQDWKKEIYERFKN